MILKYICTKCYGNPLRILLKVKSVNLLVLLKLESGSYKSVRLILLQNVCT